MAFESLAPDLVVGECEGSCEPIFNVFVHDRLTSTTELVNLGPAGLSGNGDFNFDAVLSSDGRFVAFQSNASNLLATVYQTLGVDPGMTFQNTTGRPVHILDERAPVRELL